PLLKEQPIHTSPTLSSLHQIAQMLQLEERSLRLKINRVSYFAINLPPIGKNNIVTTAETLQYSDNSPIPIPTSSVTNRTHRPAVLLSPPLPSPTIIHNAKRINHA